MMENNKYPNSGTVEENPYSSPSADLIGTQENSDSIGIREAHIKHETSIKSAGLLYYIGGFVMTIAGPAMFFSATHDPVNAVQNGGTNWLFYGLGLLYLVLGVCSLITARGLRKLRRWVKVPVGIISGIGLLNIPLGTLINGYILYLVFSKKGNFIFSERYHQIIEQTPHVKHRTSIVAWIALAAIVGLFIIAFIGVT